MASSGNTSIKIPFGVLGEYDAAGSTFGVGVVGISTTGYGIAAEALGTQPTMLALAGGSGDGIDAYTQGSANGDAVFAIAQGSGSGVYGQSSSGSGLQGHSISSTAVVGATPGYGGIGYLGEATGEGVAAYGYSGNTGHPALVAQEETSGTDLLGAYTTTGNERFIVQAGTANASGETLGDGMDVQMSGDLYVTGRIYDNCNFFPENTISACDAVALSSIAPMSDHREVQMYAAQQSSRTVEDFGNAQLVNGAGYVRLDPTFAQTISTASPYLVFVTPSSDSRGLYVSQRTQTGFVVHENGGGHSNLSFDYRIVAKPFADRSARLAIVQRKHPTGSIATRAMGPASKASILKRYGIAAHAAPPSFVTKTPPSR